jgi:gluconate 5-dehydrogenase
LSLARGLADAGARIVLNGRNETTLRAAAREISDKGVTATFVAFDVRDEIAVERGVDEIETHIGPIDILINNAGIQRRAPLQDFTLQSWREVMSMNLDSVFIVGTAVARRMIPRGRGKIINIGSLQSESARPRIAPYTTAKGGVRNLTKGMCADWAEFGLQINAIGPGYFATPLNQALIDDPEFDAWICKRTPAGRWGRVEELQGAAVFLGSAASDFINGQIIYVDGGILAVL